jgi:hemolysin activation/secretion protein
MRVRLLALGLAALGLLALPPVPARASFNPTDPPSGEHTQTDGPRYWVGKIHLSYANEHPLQPPIALLTGADYALGQASDGYVGARRGGKNVWFRLSEIGEKEPVPVYATGLQDLCEQIVTELGARGMMGVYVAPSPADIDTQTGGDVRPDGVTDLHLVVHTGRVQAVRTFQAPIVAPEGQPAQPSPDDEAIAERSPLQPVGAGDPLDRNKLDAYIARLNRQPGRMVDAVVTPTLTPGVVNLDYLVQEDRPWTISSDFSNTGTDSTGKNRQHFGFADYQVSGHDDVMLLDYVTSGFNNTNAVNGSYEIRVPKFESLRFRLGGNWSQYASDQFGFTTVFTGAPSDPNDPNSPPSSKKVHDTLHFSGTQWEVNGALVENLIGEPGFFLDSYLGARWMDVSVVNLSAFNAEMPFFVPTVGLTLDRSWPTTRLRANLAFQQSLPFIAGTSSADIEHFSDVGRANLDSSWRILTLDFGGSVFLQPWFHGTRFFTDRPLRPRELTHELAWRLSAQTSLDTRLIPQVEGVLGGAATVRGYPQSIASGDSFAEGSVEYRYHIPLGFHSVEPWNLPWGMGVFRPGPDDLLRLPDWDLVVASFLDGGKVWNTQRVLGEHNDSLASVGLGLEVIVRRNFSVRVDYGVALLAVPTANVDRGNGEVHFSALVRY